MAKWTQPQPQTETPTKSERMLRVLLIVLATALFVVVGLIGALDYVK